MTANAIQHIRPNAVAGGSVDPIERLVEPLAGYDADRLLAALSEQDKARLPAVADAMYQRHEPLMVTEPDRRGPLTQALDRALRPIGAKIAPHLSGEQATAWRVAMLMALGDLAAEVAIEAATSAIHKPMGFLSDVEKEVRDIAANIEAHKRSTYLRLRQLARKAGHGDDGTRLRTTTSPPKFI